MSQPGVGSNDPDPGKGTIEQDYSDMIKSFLYTFLQQKRRNQISKSLSYGELLWVEPDLFYCDCLSLALHFCCLVFQIGVRRSSVVSSLDCGRSYHHPGP